MNKIYKQLKIIYGKIYRTANFYEEDIAVRRIRFLISFSLIAFLFYFSFFVINIVFIKNYIEGMGLLIIGTALVVNVLIYRIRKNVPLANFSLLLLSFSTYLLLFYTGGIARTGVYWVFTFPVIAFFIQGKKGGLRWIVYLVCFLIFIDFLNYLGVFFLFFTYQEIIMCIAALILLSMLVYVYESVNEYTGEIILQKNNSLADTAKKLEKEMEIRKKTEQQLSEQIKNFEKTNRLMIGRELRIAALKEELSSYKKNK